MSSKAYPEDEQVKRGVLTDVEQREHPPFPTDSQQLSRHPTLSWKIGISEFVAALTVIYLCSIAAFNGGYFSEVPGNFVQLFTFSDLIGTNISIIQYFFGVATVYFILSILISILLPNLRQRIKARAESIAMQHHYSNALFWAAYALLFGLLMLTQAVIKEFNVTRFTVVMLPQLLFQGVLVYFFWVGYKYELVPAKALAYASLISLFMFSYISGSSWIRSEMRSLDGIQAIIGQDGLCLERKIIRSSNSGILLYNISLKQFEFRNRAWFKTIFEGKGCL